MPGNIGAVIPAARQSFTNYMRCQTRTRNGSCTRSPTPSPFGVESKPIFDNRAWLEIIAAMVSALELLGLIYFRHSTPIDAVIITRSNKASGRIFWWNFVAPPRVLALQVRRFPSIAARHLTDNFSQESPADLFETISHRTKRSRLQIADWLRIRAEFLRSTIFVFRKACVSINVLRSQKTNRLCSKRLKYTYAQDHKPLFQWVSCMRTRYVSKNTSTMWHLGKAKRSQLQQRHPNRWPISTWFQAQIKAVNSQAYMRWMLSFSQLCAREKSKNFDHTVLRNFAIIMYMSTQKKLFPVQCRTCKNTLTS